MFLQQLVELQMVHMFQQLELLGAASQQHVPTFTRPGAVGAALHLEALNFEQNQLKNGNTWKHAGGISEMGRPKPE